jgi:hypothetical protein
VYRNSGISVLLRHGRSLFRGEIGVVKRKNPMLKPLAVDTAGKRQETIFSASQQEFTDQ